MDKKLDYKIGQICYPNPIHPVIKQFFTPASQAIVTYYNSKQRHDFDRLILKILEVFDFEESLYQEDFIAEGINVGDEISFLPSYVQSQDIVFIANKLASKEIKMRDSDGNRIGYKHYLKERARLADLFEEELVYLVGEPILVPIPFPKELSHPTMPEI